MSTSDHDQPAEVEEIAALEAARVSAILAEDINYLDQLMDSECTCVDWRGATQSKHEYLASLQSHALEFDLLVTVQNDIKHWGDCAVVAGTYFNKIRSHGDCEPPRYLRHLRVYRRMDGHWRLVAHQATEAPMRL